MTRRNETALNVTGEEALDPTTSAPSATEGSDEAAHVPAELEEALDSKSKVKKKRARKAKKIKPPREPGLPWRQRVTLSGMLLWTVIGTILLVCAGIGYYAVNVLYENKLRDTWAILFLDQEQQGNWITKRLEKFASQQSDPAQAAASGRPVPDGVVQLPAPTAGSQPSAGLGVERVPLHVLSGPFQPDLTLSDLHLRTAELPTRFNIVQYGGHDYLAVTVADGWLDQRLGEKVAPGRYLAFWRIDINAWLNSRDDDAKNTIYLLSKEGRVLYSNRPEITEATYMKRPLVQKFIANPLRHGQLEFDGSEGPSFGFFHEVPDTNLMLFVETPKTAALEEVRQLAIHYVVILLIVLCLVGLMLQFPLSTLVAAPMRELVRVADEVGDGNFDVLPRRSGLGELAVLSSSFTEMAKNLVVRDKKIQALLVEQEEKFRLADELAIAHSIQNNFLIHTPLPQESGVEVAAQYMPATEVAGDWYGYYYDPRLEQSVFAVADVSGHGAGSAMFTAVVAAAFEEMRAECVGQGAFFPLEQFATRLNRLIEKLGHGQMHATLLVATYEKAAGKLTILNAGHPAPILLPADVNQPAYSIPQHSDLIGLSPDFTPVTVQVEFPRGTSLVMFTDGLIEGDPDHKLYSERRLVKAATITQSTNINQVTIRVFADWKQFLQGKTAADDVCLLAVRAVA